MSLREVGLDEIAKYKDPFKLFSEGAIALADDTKEINGLTIGWGSIGTLWRKPILSLYVHEVRYTRHILDNASGFSICFIEDKEQLRYFGTVSGKDENKILNSKLTVNYVDGIPYFEESDLVIVCKKVGQSKFEVEKIDIPNIVDWYSEDGVHTIYQGEIIKVLRK